jgi:hypothetical protein
MSVPVSEGVKLRQSLVCCCWAFLLIMSVHLRGRRVLLILIIPVRNLIFEVRGATGRASAQARGLPASGV